MPLSKIIVLDFGSQYAHLIAKRFRALGYYSEIALPSASLSEIEGAKGIVLSGGPASVYDENIPAFNKSILDSDVPILGLCYGHQLMAQHYGGTVKRRGGRIRYSASYDRQKYRVSAFFRYRFSYASVDEPSG